MPETLITSSGKKQDEVRSVLIPPVGLEGTLGLPREAEAVVLFAHGSGSSRLSPRNNYVAGALRRAGLGTLLFDLLTVEEAANRANVFDIELLAGRLLLAAEWLRDCQEARRLRLGFFGASTGAAAALVAGSRSEAPVGAIVSRGGRPDLAGPALPKVQAPTLLIVGGLDTEVLALNEAALAQLGCEKGLQVVPGATHLFEEPGTLDAVIDLAEQWFTKHLIPRATA
jgi:putative phosphoribosyl transferase